MTSTAASFKEGVGTRLSSRLAIWTVPLFSQRGRLAWTVGLSSFFVFTLYRGFLWWSLAVTTHPPLGFVIERFYIQQFISASGWDALASLLLALPFAPFGARKRSHNWLLLPVGTLSVGICGLVCAVHLKLLLTRGEHFGYDAIREATVGAMTLREAISYAQNPELVLLTAPVLLFSSTYLGVRRLSQQSHSRLALQLAVLAVIMTVSALLPTYRRFHNRIHHNPVIYGVADLIKGALRPTPHWYKAARPVSAAQLDQLALIDEQFLAPSIKGLDEAPENEKSPAYPKPLNVVLIVLESTSGLSVFEPTPKGEIPMPGLKALAEQSWWMDFHHSTSNSSHRSLFSLLTGLYPSFGKSFFCITDEIEVPTLVSYLPKSYVSFLVTPGDVRSYFPRRVFEKSGFSELVDRSALAPGKRPSKTIMAVNEFDALEAFEKRLTDAEGRPFFAAYYSFVPHFDYEDYGDEFRIMPNAKDTKHRYINNLRVADAVVGRIVARLKAQGVWDSTILAIVGDHGEAFGEHGHSTHANDMHEEPLRTPFLLHIPGSKPRKFQEPTSHIDLVPTLLDLLGIPFDPARFQGESLNNPVRRRAYIFGVGNEASYVSIDQDRSKLIAQDRTNRCLRYDLKTDPREKQVKACVHGSAQYQALADFRRFQSSILQRESQKERVRAHK